MNDMLRVAIVGSGIAGLAAAHALQGKARLTLFEAGEHFGGHANTVNITLPTAAGRVTHGVDTGFLVFNSRTYPQLIELFAQLGVATAASEMSFSVQAAGAAWGGGTLSWSGTSINSVFAQRRNLLNWRFLRMLGEIMRFNRVTTALAQSHSEADNAPDPAQNQPLGEFLDVQGFSPAFRDWYFLPMMACIWSCPTAQMLRFPVSTMVRFCYNHGLIQVANRPAWRTVAGGSQHYVKKITAGIIDKRLRTPVRAIERDESLARGGVLIHLDSGPERFDKVVLATHSDQSLALLKAPTPAEHHTLGAIGYQANRAVLHTDASVLPAKQLAWAAWNYERAQHPTGEPSPVCLHYLLNKLQPLPFEQPVLVSLNPLREIARTLVLGEYNYMHPVFDLAAINAQGRLPELQGRQHSYFCGAWAGYGFHEDGLKSGLEAASLLTRDLAGAPA